MREWLKKREEYSHLVLLNEIILSDQEDYRNYFRMDEACFQKLLGLVQPFIARCDTNMRECISPSERLTLTLRYLATGRTFEDGVWHISQRVIL